VKSGTCFAPWLKIIEAFDASGCLVLDAMESLCDAGSAMKNGLFAGVSSKFSNAQALRMIRADIVAA
jgi:hypothetical protein